MSRRALVIEDDPVDRRLEESLLTGEGYEGHYFWDTETYVLPVFLYTRPEIARNLLEHRYSLLDKSRARAKAL